VSYNNNQIIIYINTRGREGTGKYAVKNCDEAGTERN
jgi:hypothetical protein